MKYIEMIMQVERKKFELVQAALLEGGFGSMQIDDPLDALEIAEHRELYKYDYINEEIVSRAAEAEKARNAAGAGAAASRSGRDDIVITLFFTDDEEGRRQLNEAKDLLGTLNTSLSADYAAAAHPGIRFETSVTGDDSEWLYKWQEYFKPVKIGGRIVVRPGWEDYEASEDELVIEMDPGMAFGSGLHETTSMCIKALENVIGAWSDNDRSGSGRQGATTNGQIRTLKVLDVGTGTGILAMAAVLLGADEALGIDIDDEAVRVSSENIAKNGLGDRISIRKGNLMDGIDYDPDIIVANLMADLVMMLSPAAASQLKAGGAYITSGILDIKEETVSEAIRAAGFAIKEIMADGEWRAIVAVRDER